MSSMIGSFAELNSGGPVPFVAQLIDWNPSARSVLCKWLWRPQDLPAALLEAPRSLASFGRNELLMCTSDPAGADWNPRDSLLREHVRVLPFGEWRKQGDLAAYFYRQVYDVVARTLLPVEAVQLDLVQLPDGATQVVNPDIRYFQCPQCALVFDGGCVGVANAAKTKPSDLPVSAECPTCIQTSWKSRTPPSDEKRHAVVERVAAGLRLAVDESTVSAFLGDSAEAVTALASAIEQRLVDDLGLLSKEYKAQARALIFNFTDVKNRHLRAQVVSGSFPLWKLSRATADELASQTTKETREAEREKYFHEQVVLSGASETSPKADSSPTLTSSPSRRRSTPPAAAPGRAEPTRKRGEAEKTAKLLIAELGNLKNTEIADRMRKFIQGTTPGAADDSVSVLKCNHSYHRRCIELIRTEDGHYCSVCNRVIIGPVAPVYLTYDEVDEAPRAEADAPEFDPDWAMALKELACMKTQLRELEGPVAQDERDLKSIEATVKEVNARVQEQARANSALSTKEKELVIRIKKIEDDTKHLLRAHREEEVSRKVLQFFDVLRDDHMGIPRQKQTLDQITHTLLAHDDIDQAACLYQSAFKRHKDEVERKVRLKKRLELDQNEITKEIRVLTKELKDFTQPELKHKKKAVQPPRSLPWPSAVEPVAPPPQTDHGYVYNLGLPMRTKPKVVFR